MVTPVPSATLLPVVVVPTYNEAENIEAITAAILETLEVGHVLIVDDSSPDGTGEIADRLAEGNPRVHVLHRTSKDGLGRAYIAGFKWALTRDYTHILEMDADFSHDPGYLPEMLRQAEHYDLVIGSRYVQGGGTSSWGLLRRLMSRGGGVYARTVLGIDIQDLTAGFMCYRRAVLESIDLDGIGASGYGFQIEMKYKVAKMGWRILEIPIHFPDRVHGESKMSASVFTEALTLVWRLRLGI